MRFKLSPKTSDIAAYAAVLLGYFFIVGDGLDRPFLAVVASIAGAWIGVEIAVLITKALGKNPKS